MMMMNEEPVRVTIQGTQMIEDTLTMRRFKSGPSKQRRDGRKKRTPRDGDTSMNNNLYQGKLYNDDTSYYRHEKTSSQYQYTNSSHQQFQIPQSHHYQQAPQSNFQPNQQVPPASPLQITPPISSAHPLSSFATPSQPIQSNQVNGHPLMMCSSQVQMPMPMQVPISMPLPMVNLEGSAPQIPIQMPIQMPLQMPMHMTNMPLPMFIRLPAPSCVPPASPNGSDDNLKSNVSNGVGPPPPTGPAIINFIPLMFPPHLGPMLLGPSQPVMVSHLPPSSPFHFMMNDNQEPSTPIDQQPQPQATK